MAGGAERRADAHQLPLVCRDGFLVLVPGRLDADVLMLAALDPVDAALAQTFAQTIRAHGGVDRDRSLSLVPLTTGEGSR